MLTRVQRGSPSASLGFRGYSSDRASVRVGNYVHIKLSAIVRYSALRVAYLSVNSGTRYLMQGQERSGVLTGAEAVLLKAIEPGDRSLVGANTSVVLTALSSAATTGVPAR